MSPGQSKYVIADVYVACGMIAGNDREIKCSPDTLNVNNFL